MMKIYDAENQVLGRLCSKIAKDLLGGEKVIVVNCEKTVISGNPKMIQKAYMEKRSRGDVFHGPFFPKYPDGIFRRTVRGMLPWDRTSGRKAFRNLRVFIGLPEELKGRKIEKMEDFDASDIPAKSITLSDLSVSIGADKKW